MTRPRSPELTARQAVAGRERTPLAAGHRPRRRRSTRRTQLAFPDLRLLLGQLALKPVLPRGTIAAGLAALLFVIAAYEVAARDRIMPGVRAVGTSVGWLGRTEAAQQLGPNLQEFLSRPIELRYPNGSWTVTASDLGLEPTADDIAAAAFRVGRNGSVLSRLADQARALVGGASVSVASGIDQAKLDAFLNGIAGQVDRSPTDAHLAIAADGTIQHDAAQTGLSLDVEASRARILNSLSRGDSTIDLRVRELQPSVGNDLVQAATQQLQAMLGQSGSPLTLTRGQESWPLDRADVAALVSVNGGGAGQPATIAIDDQRLQALVSRLAGEVDQSVQNARFAFNGGNLTVLRPSKEGRTLDQTATAALIKTKLLAGEHTAELPVTTVAPTVSSDDPASLGIVEKIDGGSTSFAGSVPEKKWNIKLAAERLNGVVVPPGGTFSFNKEVGPTTLEAGFKWGYGIEAGKNGAHTVPSVGGGICQVATTLFQPVFWSGYQLEERYWHLYWIPAYTSRGLVGLDVTVDEDSNLDFKWSNPTNDYILIQSGADDNNVYFSLYGKKPPWKVDVTEGDITNRVPASQTPVTEDEPTLAWGQSIIVQAPRDGFEITVTRKVTPNDGGEPRVLRLHSKYQAVPKLTLIGTLGKPANLPSPTATSGPQVSVAPTAVAQNRPAVQSADTPSPKPTPVPPPPAVAAITPVTVVPGAGALPTPTTVVAAPTLAPAPASR